MAMNPNFGRDAGSYSNAGVPETARAIKGGSGGSDGIDRALQDVSVWAVSGDIYFGCPAATPSLKPGFYACKDSMRGPYLERMEMATDDLLQLPDPICDMLLGEFVEFWRKAPQFSKLGLTTKRGLILWGPPGSGKTSAVQRMAAHMIHEMDGVVVMAGDPDTTTQCLHMLRKIEPNRPLIVVYEDLDALVGRYGEARYLAMLDGELQVSGVVNVATTNYPERLDKRFVDRPGRFDRVTFVGMPQEAARSAYFVAKAPHVDEVTRARWVKATESWSIAHLRELIVATQVLGETEDVTIKRLTEMQEHLNSDAPPEEDALGYATLNRNTRKRIGL